MTDHLKPQHFLVRENGIIVPLVAMDELPHHIRIEGVPRNMTIDQTAGMSSVGPVSARHQQYNVVSINDSSSFVNETPQESISYSSSNIGSDPADDNYSSAPSEFRKDIPTLLPVSAPSHKSLFQHVTAADTVVPGLKKAYGVQEQKPHPAEESQAQTSLPVIQSLLPGFQQFKHDFVTTISPTEALQTTAYGKPEPLPAWKDTTELGARFPPPGKKVYCSHWMSTGECDYAQQGCIFKHEMPLDIALLNHLGYQDIPKWYRERHGIGRLTAVPGSGAHMGGPASKNTLMQSSWRPVAVNTSRQRMLASTQSSNPAFRSRTSPWPTKAKTHQSKFTADSLLLDDDDSITNVAPTENQPLTLSLLNSRYASMQPSTGAAPAVHTSTTFAPGTRQRRRSGSSEVTAFSDADTKYFTAETERRERERVASAERQAAMREKAEKERKEKEDVQGVAAAGVASDVAVGGGVGVGKAVEGRQQRGRSGSGRHGRKKGRGPPRN